MLGPKELGIYSIALAMIGLGATVATLGLPALVTREVAKSHVQEEWGRLKGILSVSRLLMVLVSGALLLATACVFAAGWATPERSWLILCSTAIVPMVAVNQVRGAVLRGLNLVTLAEIPELALRPALTIILVIGVYVSVERVSATAAIFVQLVAVLGSFLLGAWFFRKHLPYTIRKTKSELNALAWSREAQPFFWITVISVLESQVGTYVLGIVSDLEQVGLFQVASQMVSLIVLGLMAVNAPLQPRLSAAWETRNTTESQELVTEAARLGTIIAVTAAILLAPFAQVVVHLFGAQFEGASNVLRVLVVGQVINAACGSCGLVLIATGYQRFYLYAFAVALIVNVLASISLAPLYGAIGAAAAAVASFLVWNGLMVYWAFKKTGLRTAVVWLPLKRETTRF